MVSRLRAGKFGALVTMLQHSGAVCSVQCTVFSVTCGVCSFQCALQCAVCLMYFSHNMLKSLLVLCMAGARHIPLPPRAPALLGIILPSLATVCTFPLPLFLHYPDMYVSRLLPETSLPEAAVFPHPRLRHRRTLDPMTMSGLDTVGTWTLWTTL